MSSVPSVHPLDSPSSSSREEDADKQNNTAITYPLPHSPLVNRSCPGQATPTVSNSSSSVSSVHSYSSLFKLIDSSVFNCHFALFYLFKPSHTEVWEYLAKRLFDFRTSEVDFYFPQILILFQRSDEGNRCLLPYLSYRVRSSLRFATQLAWLLDTHQVSSAKSSHSKINSSASTNALHSLKLPSVNAITSSSSSMATTAVEVVQGTSEQKSPVPGGSNSSSDSLNCQGDDEGSCENINGTVVLQSRTIDADHLTNHKRADSDVICLTGTEAQSRDSKQLVSVSQAFKSYLEDNDSQGDDGADAGGSSNRNDACDAVKSARSESWAMMHSGFCAPTLATRSDTHLHVRPPHLPRTGTFSLTSFSTDLLYLHPSQTQQLNRLQNTLSDFLDCAAASSSKNSVELHSKASLQPDKFAWLCRNQWDFVNALLCISRKLTAFPSKEQRTLHLQAELNKLNMGLPARVWLPVEKTEHVVLRIPTSAAVCLNSAEKAPYLIYVEILECNDVMTVRLPQRTVPISGFTTSNIPNHRFHDNNTYNYSPQLTPSSSKTYLSSPGTIAASDKISLFSMDSGESQGPADTSVVTFAAGPNPSLTAQSADEEPSNSAQQFKQPTVCYVNAKEIRRRLELNLACLPQRSFKLDPEDPSAVVLKEPWELKAHRIKESSPWGHLPGWRLAAAIIKVGDDLRQEQLAYQLLTSLQRIWRETQVPLWLRPLNIAITSPDSGLIELVQDTFSLHQIRRHSRLSLRDYIIREHGSPTSEGFLTAQINFVQSCAAYCLVGYLFQVKDRHNGNILIDKEGHVIHIDYGFMLSASPGRNLGFEMSPFKLTSEQVELMDGVDSDMFTYYKSLILRGLLAARKYMEELILIVDITQAGYPDLPCFHPGGGKRAVEALRQRFMLTSTEDTVTRFVDCMIRQSLNSLTTRLYDNYQYFANGIQ
nr:phosphatidylinositol 4 kinase beta [Hymenolepis microstoma]